MGINLLKIPVDSEQFSDFINKSKIFDQTHELMKGYLVSWYNDNSTAFVEYMRVIYPLLWNDTIFTMSVFPSQVIVRFLMINYVLWIIEAQL